MSKPDTLRCEQLREGYEVFRFAQPRANASGDLQSSDFSAMHEVWVHCAHVSLSLFFVGFQRMMRSDDPRECSDGRNRVYFEGLGARKRHLNIPTEKFGKIPKS